MNRATPRLGLALLISTVISFSFSTQASQADAGVFFGYPDVVNARLSPDGARVALISMASGAPRIYRLNVESEEKSLIFDIQEYANEQSRIDSLTWIDSHHVALQLHASQQGIENLLDTKTSSRLLLINVDTGEETQRPLSVRTTGKLAHPLPDKPGTFLYSTDGLYSKVYSVNIEFLAPDQQRLGKLDQVDGGQFRPSNEVSSVEGHAFRWFFNNSSEIVSALLVSEGKIQLKEFNGDADAESFEILDIAEAEEASEHGDQRLIPIMSAAQPGYYYCLDLNETPRRTVYLANFKTGQEKKVHQTDHYKIVDLMLNKDGALAGVQVLAAGSIAYEFIDQESGALEVQQQGRLTSALDHSARSNRSLVYQESHNSAGEFWLLNHNDETRKSLGSVYPGLPELGSHRLEKGSVTVEGLEVPYLLNLPPKTDQALPLVVMPHGGPMGVFDTDYYDAPTQFLVANGFAVLRVNFRGSGGISSHYRDAGQGEWGGLMLEDTHQATRAVVAREDIDNNRTCLAGFSYGAYASAMLLVKHPEQYQCGAMIAGVFDLNTLLNSTQLNATQRSGLKESIGVGAKETELLTAKSPLYLLKNLRRPVFLGHGGNDRITDIEQAHRMQRMLSTLGKPYDFHLEPDANHHFSNPEHATALFENLASFLAKHN